jgi:hypothetical protein
MRINHLQIEQFGHFVDQQYPLDERFQVIYGENEAGKTTLLNLFRSILFGFEAQCSYSKLAKEFGRGDIAGAIQATLRDGQAIKLRRRKGVKNTVDGEFVDSGMPIQESDWLRLLGNANRLMYQNLFGFSLKELNDGSESLKQASLTDALYGSGFGGFSHINRVKDRLEKDLKEIYLSAGRNQIIPTLLRSIKSKREELTESQFKPEFYDSLKTELDEIDHELTEKNSLKETLTEQVNQLRLYKQGWEPFHDLIGINRDLEECVYPDTLPHNALELWNTTEKELQIAESERERLNQKKAKLLGELPNEEGMEILQARNKIELLQRSAESIKISIERRKEIQDELSEVREQLSSKENLNQYFADETPNLQLNQVDQDQLKDLLDEHLQLQKDLLAHEQKLSSNITLLEKKQGKLTELQQLYQESSQFNLLQKEVQEVDLQIQGIERLEKVLAEQLTSAKRLELDLQLNDKKILISDYELPVPSLTEVKEFVEQEQKINNETKLLKEQVKQEQINLQDYEDEKEVPDGQIITTHDPREAVKEAVVVYTDVWASMGQEEETAKRAVDFADFQVNSELMKEAPQDAFFMHCLPAHREEEVTADVIDGPQSIVFEEAENRLHAQKGMLAWLLASQADK